jgi:UDP-N-acetyl-D-galactosamine dehydrogenase
MNFTADPKTVVVGLGYVGLPLAVALAEHFETIGYDIDQGRVDELRRGHDRTGEIAADRLAGSALTVTGDAETRGADTHIVTAPTPVARIGLISGRCARGEWSPPC